MVVPIVVAIMVACTGCARNLETSPLPPVSTSSTPFSSTPVPSSPISSILVSSSSVSSSGLQQYKNLAVKFHAVLTFSLNNVNVSYPTDLAVPEVPITWSGTSFSGTLHESGPGEDITDKVAGTISADGKVVISLVYSRQVLRTTNSGTAFKVTLSNVSLEAGTIPGTFNYSGAVIRGYFSEIYYADGTIVSGQIVPSTIYISTDWENTQQSPTLTIAFGGR